MPRRSRPARTTGGGGGARTTAGGGAALPLRPACAWRPAQPSRPASPTAALSPTGWAAVPPQQPKAGHHSNSRMPASRRPRGSKPPPQAQACTRDRPRPGGLHTQRGYRRHPEARGRAPAASSTCWRRAPDPTAERGEPGIARFPCVKPRIDSEEEPEARPSTLCYPLDRGRYGQ